jgi:glycosyltransferase involved in cell wall biosynthesis
MTATTGRPAVSVIIPVFNSERYISAALASIQAQTFTDVEVLLIDDGSTDGTLREAGRFAGSLALTIVQQANAGPSAARYNGIRRARGRYCAFLDADDVMLPDLLGAQVAVLEEHPDVGLVFTDVTTFDERGTLREGRWGFSAARGGSVLERLLLDNFVTTSAVMAPRARLIEAGLFPEHRRVAEDYELWLKLAVRWTVRIIDRPLVRYRYSAGSLSSDKLHSARCALDVIEAFWKEHPEYRRSHPATYRRSLGRHMTNAGAAALAEGRRGIALRYLVESVRHDPMTLRAWKSLAKALVMPRAPRPPYELKARA